MKIVIVGAGMVGFSLAKHFSSLDHNIAIVARKIKLRYETLHRKLRSLGLI